MKEQVALRQESSPTSSAGLGPGTLEVSPPRAELGRGTGLERETISCIVGILSLTCLLDVEGKRCVVLGRFLNLSGPRFSHL